MDCANVRFSGHAFQRMFLRSIDRDMVISVLLNGQIIAEYPDDQPYPSALVLGFDEGRPIHVVVGQDPTTRSCVVVTVYIPDPARWTSDFKSRRSR